MSYSLKVLEKCAEQALKDYEECIQKGPEFAYEASYHKGLHVAYTLSIDSVKREMESLNISLKLMEEHLDMFL